MTLKLPSFLRSRAAISTAVGLTLIAGVTVAQTTPMEPVQWDKRRLEQLDRNVRRLERAVTQRNAAGQPVLVEPDPEVIALQGRVASLDRRLQDLEQSFQRVNGELERLSFAADEATRDNAALRNRLNDSEARVDKMEAEAREAAELNAPIVANSPTGDAGQDLIAATRLAATNPVRADRALQVVVVTWPDTPEAREANYRLGDLRVSQNDHPGAVQAYAAALSGWPRVGWAGEATIKLATALVETDRKTQACAALGEFTRRYAQAAPAALKTRATELRTRAACAA